MLFEGLGYGFSRATYEETYSPDWYQTYRALGIPESIWEKVDLKWLELHDEESYDLIPGAREALVRLRSRGVSLAVVTSGSRERVSVQAAEMALDDLFDVMVYSEDVRSKKPDPEGLHVGLRGLGIEGESAVYVGDSPEDIQMAKAAGVLAVAIPGGFPNREALEASEPDLLAGSIKEATEMLLT